MKILPATLFVFLLFTSCIIADGSDSSQTIYIITKDDDVAAFRTIGKIFSFSGYDLEDSEEALMDISTAITNKPYGVFNLNKIAVKLRAAISMTDTITIIKLTGKYLEKAGLNSELSESFFNSHSVRISCSGQPDTAAGTAWGYMMEIAKKYRNGKIKTAL